MGNFSMLRVFRLLRIFRAIRAIRLVSYLKELRVLLASVVSCAASLFWAALLFLMFVCLYALYLEDISLAYLKETYNNEFDQSSKDTITNLKENWNGMGRTVRSLVFCITGGKEWADMSQPFWIMGTGNGISFMLFMSLMVIGLLNILIGVFVGEADTKRQGRDEESSRLFDILDTDSDGLLSFDEISEGFQNKHLAADLELIEHRVGTETVTDLFNILDVDGSKSITKLEFTQGLAKLYGHACASADLLLEEQKILRKLNQLQQHVNQLEDALVTLDYHVGGHHTSKSSE